MSEIRNFKISATHLGYESHGIFTAYLTLQSAGFGISVGGYALDEFIDKKRIITKKGAELIPRILDVVGVETWEQLAGQYIRVEDNGIGESISKIGNLIEDNWLDFDRFLKE
ncbi:hypothetical protein GU334_05110 [Lactococcus raffinolactis]|jgi:hypothetical protein|uniref:Uncharacterized protein n=1 Tax=Pseudolactococcus raffinolactis TaxID=1366 RepID=A0AAE6YKX7_9LACT|nr:hypothetical protein [Lactococcus raffinolactis]QIW58317.1 hypothetical protein GU334_05110 [Lactococcus raffinolactis]